MLLFLCVAMLPEKVKHCLLILRVIRLPPTVWIQPERSSTATYFLHEIQRTTIRFKHKPRLSHVMLGQVVHNYCIVDAFSTNTLSAPAAVVLQLTASPWTAEQEQEIVIREIKLRGKQPAAIELTRRDHSTDTRLHNHYIGTNQLR